MEREILMEGPGSSEDRLSPRPRGALLSRLLPHEITNVEIYQSCLPAVTTACSATIATCRDSHLHRCALIEKALAILGVPVTYQAGLWGTFATILMSAATYLGDEAILAVLELEEEETLSSYRECLERIDQPTGDWLREYCVREQLVTFGAVHDLRLRLSQ